jgi:hypothetical protein
MQDLTLEIRKIHDIIVNEAQSTDAGCGQIERDRRTEASRPDTKDTGGFNPFLAIEGHFRHDEVARITRDLIVTKIDALKPVF